MNTAEMNTEAIILHYKKRIIEFEKFRGPIAVAMIEHLKRRIDSIRRGF